MNMGRVLLCVLGFFFPVENLKKIFCFGKLEVDYLD